MPQFHEDTILWSLYFIDGNLDYRFINSLGKEQKLIPSDKEIMARQVLVSTRSKKRNLEDMIVRITSYNVCYTKLLRSVNAMSPVRFP